MTPAPDATLVEHFVRKWGAFFGLTELELPDIAVRDNLGSKWLAVTVWDPKMPETSTIVIQKTALADARTVDKIVAHEIIHHINFLRMDPTERALLTRRRGSLSDGHDQAFWRLADRVNAEMGGDFVTERSSQDYALAENEKVFHVLIEPLRGDKIGWSWISKLTPQAKEEVRRREAGAKNPLAVVETTDVRLTRGVKLKKYGGCSVARAGSDEEAILRELYESAQ
jgi:hypothetical protein